VNREVTDRLPWRRSKSAKAELNRANIPESLIPSGERNVVVHADVLLVQPVNGGQERRFLVHMWTRR